MRWQAWEWGQHQAVTSACCRMQDSRQLLATHPASCRIPLQLDAMVLKWCQCLSSIFLAAAAAAALLSLAGLLLLVALCKGHLRSLLPKL